MEEDSYANRRAFVRHPIQVPLSVRVPGGEEFRSRVADISEGGVSFTSPLALEKGGAVEVVIPVHDSRFTLTGTVAWCSEAEDGGFRIGLSFIEPGTHFKMKLAEQVLRIEDLQQTLSRERGVSVTRQEAADLWVERYASNFADLYATDSRQGAG
jgi:hypothetical protein